MIPYCVRARRLFPFNLTQSFVCYWYFVVSAVQPSRKNQFVIDKNNIEH